MALVTFSDILGQTAAVEWLRGAMAADRLPHGLVFAGPVGVGKATTAAALAAAVLCPRTSDAKPCGQCDSCRLMAVQSHPDYHRVYRQLVRIDKKDAKARDLPVSVIRDYLVGPVNLKPSLGHGKVFIVEEADLMNPSAQNSMLKTLEEPIGRTAIILITEQPFALLPTIRSRCQLLRFAALPEPVVAGELTRRGLTPARAAQAADIAAGSLGLALRWHEDGVIDAAIELRRRIEQLIGGQPPDGMPEWMRKAADDYAGKQLERDPLASEDQARREGLGLYLRIAAGVFRAHLANSDDPQLLEALCDGIDAAARAEEYLDANVGLALVLQQWTAALEGRWT